MLKSLSISSSQSNLCPQFPPFTDFFNWQRKIMIENKIFLFKHLIIILCSEFLLRFNKAQPFFLWWLYNLTWNNEDNLNHKNSYNNRENSQATKLCNNVKRLFTLLRTHEVSYVYIKKNTLKFELFTTKINRFKSHFLLLFFG